MLPMLIWVLLNEFVVCESNNKHAHLHCFGFANWQRTTTTNTIAIGWAFAFLVNTMYFGGKQRQQQQQQLPNGYTKHPQSDVMLFAHRELAVLIKTQWESTERDIDRE